MGTKTTETRFYKLGGYVVEEDNGGVCWSTFVEWDGGNESGKPMVEQFSGPALTTRDTLILYPWKVRDDPKMTTDEWDKWFESLPAWDKTKYWVKVADIGMSGLVNCETGEDVPDDIATPIMLSLGFHKVGAS